MKIYAVKCGRKMGKFSSWAECEAQVKGFSGAKYKSFTNEMDADAYLDGDNVSKTGADAIDCPTNDITYPIAYVDGSYDTESERYAYGCVIIENEENEIYLSGCDNKDEMKTMRNVAGEISGAMAAMQYAFDHDLKSMTIYHDYEGIAKWCTGHWQARKECTKAYQQFYANINKCVKITFEKVDAHTGDYYNEIVDGLAKKALGLESNLAWVREKIEEKK